MSMPVANRCSLAVALGVLLTVAFVEQGNEAQIERGFVLFDRPFQIAEGLGAPGMNGDSCRACHQDPAVGGSGGLELNVSRFGFDNGGAGPFQELSGGQMASRLFPPHTPYREEIPAQADCFEQRQTPTLFGAGLIDSIPDYVILGNEDPLDADQDGVRGVARRLTIGGVIEVGRFGWKAQIPRLFDFVRDATMGELGITTSDDGRGFGARTDDDGVPDPEMTDEQVADLAAFMASLPAPSRVDPANATVMQGEQVFFTVGCVKCHVPSLSGAAGPVALYSDLLLHDIMPAGFRGMAEPGAGSGLYRTPPLWGIRDTAPYMHDGRAEDLLAAVLAHHGEAEQVRLDFEARSDADRAALIRFLEDL